MRFESYTISLFLTLLTACTAPNHLGNPLTLPIRAITSTAENAAYDRERARVKTWITRNEPTLRAEQFDGPTTDALLETLPPQNRAQAQADLKDAARHENFPERATVIIMVHR